MNGGNILVKKKRGEWEKGNVCVGCEEGWFDGFVVDWFLAGRGVVGIVLDGGVVGVDLVGAGGWKYFFFGGGGSVWEVCLGRDF